MSKVRGTPTPWRAVREADLDGHPEIWIEGPNGETVARVRVNSATDEMDAFRIVATMNLHEMLMGAVRGAINACEAREFADAKTVLQAALHQAVQEMERGEFFAGI